MLKRLRYDKKQRNFVRGILKGPKHRPNIYKNFDELREFPRQS